MKKTDLAMIVLIAAVSVLVAFFVTRSIFGDDPNQAVKVKTIEAVEATVVEPDTSIFNEDAINPAVEVQINSGTE